MSEAHHWYETAVAAEEGGDWAGAVVALERAVALAPEQAGWHHRLGRLRLRQRRWREAVTAFEAALRVQPGRASRHYWLGRARHRCWDLAGARAAYVEAVRRAPRRLEWSDQLARLEKLQEEFRPFQGLVIAHRGRCGGGAENAVESLPTLPGHVAGVEVDVRTSRDGVPVLMHDSSVDRTTDGQGRVGDLSYRQLRRLRGVDGARVPSLADYLAACADRPLQLLVLDLKEPVGAALAATVEVVHRSPVRDRCVLVVRNEQQLAEVRALSTQLRLGCFGTVVENAAEQVRAARAWGAELLLTMFGSRRYLANRAVVPQARAAGLRVGASTINSWDAIEAARIDGCDLFLTDVADQLDRFTGAA